MYIIFFVINLDIIIWIFYSIAFHKDVDQVESLLRAIYKPHNFYCLHVDNKSSLVINM